MSDPFFWLLALASLIGLAVSVLVLVDYFTADRTIERTTHRIRYVEHIEYGPRSDERPQ